MAKSEWWRWTWGEPSPKVWWSGSFPSTLLEVDLCRPDCPKISKDGLLHATRVRRWLPDKEEAWMKNLEGIDGKPEDELSRLRERAEALGNPKRPEGGEKGKEKSSTSGESSRRKKDKKRKKKKKEKDKKGGREGNAKRIQGSKEVSVVFGSTGLDPDYQVRRKVVKKAKKIAKKREKHSSSSSSGSSSSFSDGEPLGSGLFGQEARVKAVWLQAPGALTCSTLEQMQTALVQQLGMSRGEHCHLSSANTGGWF